MLIPFLLTVLPNPLPATVPATAAVTSVTTTSQDEEIKDKRPEIKEKLELLKDHIGERGEQDQEAVSVIDGLLQEFPKCGPKDRGAIVKGLSKCFDQKRQDLSEGIPNNQLYLAAATALGEMGEDATDTITKWVGNKKHRKNIALQRVLVLSLGKTKDTDAIKDLLDLLNDKDNVIIAAAAEACGEFAAADQKHRKEIFNDLLKILVTTKALKDSDMNDIASRDRWDVISGPINTTLQVLTGEEESNPENWQRWWNKNKKADWDAED